MMAKAKEKFEHAAAAVVSGDNVSLAPSTEYTEDGGDAIPAKPQMIDSRTDDERFLDVSGRFADLMSTFADEMQAGKPALIHPCVVSDGSFLVGQVKHWKRRAQKAEKQLEKLLEAE